MEAAKKPTPIAIIAKSSMANYLSKASQAGNCSARLFYRRRG
jgi:hypothetical protein